MVDDDTDAVSEHCNILHAYQPVAIDKRSYIAPKSSARVGRESCSSYKDEIRWAVAE